MKEFIDAIKCTLICQLICWGLFIICDENKLMLQTNAEELALICGIGTLIVLFIVYFIYADKYVKNNNMNSIKFNIILFFLWLATSSLTTYGLCILVDNNILHACYDSGWACFLNGIEYLIEGFFMIVFALLVLIIKITIIFCLYIVKVTKKR